MYSSSFEMKTATILSGATTSDEIDCGMTRAARLSMPAAFTGTALGVQVLARDGSTYQTLYTDAGAAYTITVAAGREIVLNLGDFLGIEKMKLVSNAAEGGDRSIGVVLIP